MDVITLHLILLLFTLGALQGLIHTPVMIYQSIRRREGFYLGMLLLLFALACLKTVLQEATPSVVVAWPLVYQFAWGPLLLLSTRYTLYEGFKWQSRLWWWFLPSIIFDAVAPFVLTVVGKSVAWTGDIAFLIDVLAFVHFGYYILQALRTLRSYQKGLEGFYANISEATLGSLQSLYVICIVLSATWLFYVVSTLMLGSYEIPGTVAKTYYPAYAWFSVAIYYLVYRWYRKPVIQLVPIPLDEAAESTETLELKYDPEKLLQQIQIRRLYLDPKLTLKTLAAQLEVNINDLSQAFNTGLGRSFSDVINGERVAHVQRLMKDPEYAHLSLLGQALESGFNSKATFNRAFKRHTGMSPTQYKRSIEVE